MAADAAINDNGHRPPDVFAGGLSALHGSYAGEDLTFDSFEEGAAAGRNVGYLVGEAEFVDASNRVCLLYTSDAADD